MLCRFKLCQCTSRTAWRHYCIVRHCEVQGRLRERLVAAVGEEETAQLLAPAEGLNPVVPHCLEDVLSCPISQVAPPSPHAPTACWPPACMSAGRHSPPAAPLPVRRARRIYVQLMYGRQAMFADAFK